MSGCANPNPYHPRHPDGSCHYWTCRDADGTTYDTPRCTYWMREAWRPMCESAGMRLQQQERESRRMAAMTPQEIANEEGRLF